MHNYSLISIGLLLLSACARSDAPPATSIYDLMLDIVAPATNTLWSVENPQNDADWGEFVAAAARVINAGEQIKRGGNGPDDMAWAADPDWQAFADRLIGAAIDARNAAEAQDLDALFNANDVLYPPCEECHIQFHPGVEADELN